MIEIVNEGRTLCIPLDDLIHLREAGMRKAERAKHERKPERVESLRGSPESRGRMEGQNITRSFIELFHQMEQYT